MQDQTHILPVVEADEWLQPVADKMWERHERYLQRLEAINRQSGSIVDYANGYRYFGWQWDEAMDGWWFREWLPEAEDVFIFGDFNSWQRTQLRLDKDANGVWHKLGWHMGKCGKLFPLPPCCCARRAIPSF